MDLNDDKTSADFEYERYELLKEYRPENDIPDDDLLPHDTRIAQGISEQDASSLSQDDPLPERRDASSRPLYFRPVVRGVRFHCRSRRVRGRESGG